MQNWQNQLIKINAIKHIPIWIILSHDDPLVVGWRFSFPSYRALLRNGEKNCWFSYFETVEGLDIQGMKYFGHWSWARLFNDQVTKVQDREKIETFGFVPSDNCG